uniref:Uncharacterized protein n=1 Tax=Moniliophthora roreri TaxID=221103 RepID=A0A0W0FFV1_MONRR
MHGDQVLKALTLLKCTRYF